VAAKLSNEIIAAINDSASVIVLSATGKDGSPYSEQAVKVQVREDGRIAWYELLESSQTQKNLVYSIWNDREVSILVSAPDRKNYLILGKPYRALMAGREFEREYVDVQKEFGSDTDLSTVWLIDVVSYSENTYSEGRKREKEEHPLLMHLDHIFKETI
jgi:hypothetical protein